MHVVVFTGANRFVLSLSPGEPVRAVARRGNRFMLSLGAPTPPAPTPPAPEA